MLWTDYTDALRKIVHGVWEGRRSLGGAALLLHRYGTQSAAGKDYPLFALDIPSDGPALIVSAGFHGEEQAGPLTLLHRLEDIAQYARSKKVWLRLYPCVNPAGFEHYTRYPPGGNANNWLYEYETVSGQWHDCLPLGTQPDFAEKIAKRLLGDQMQPETRAFLNDIVDRKLPDLRGLLDLHQDFEAQPDDTYAYVFGERKLYIQLMSRAAEIAAHPVRAQQVDTGEFDGLPVLTDEHAMIEYYDGSICAYAWEYLKVPYSATLETAARMPLDQAHAVNMIWVNGFVDLCQKVG